jgi:beta-1,4-mannosyl-glycoprotein beta-1,4-N-acetylglucosaminyltransferase
MIVKNEAHIIIDTLTKLLSKITFEYYVICDTGSTDNTIKLIETFFKNVIPGEIHIHEWKNFGYNRTLALNAAYKKTDYVLIFDADDSIEGNLVLPELTADAYMLQFGSSQNAYNRMCLVKNDILWKYIGVLHEYIATDQPIKKETISGDYFVFSGRTSSRNNDPEKYKKDAEILENGYIESLELKDNLHNRYSYYCANSYLDAGDKENAIKWYKNTLTLQGWFDERYNSCLKLYDLTQNKDYLVESYHHNPRRVEGIYYLIRHYTCEGMYAVGMGYYSFIKGYYENEYITDNLSDKLFANVMEYTFYLPYYMIIVCEKLKDFQTGLKMFEIIFEKKTTGGQWWSNNLLFNLQFFEYRSLKNLESYLTFLESSGIKIDYTQKHLAKKTKKYDILFYTGFAETPWNESYSKTHAMGGSERAVIYLSNILSKEYSILISGDVISEKIGSIEYISRFQLNDTFEFNTIIVSRYVSFFTIYPNIKSIHVILMAHDTHFMNNLQGCNKSANEIIKNNFSKIDTIVYLTEWQKNHYILNTHKEVKEIKSVIINNGIEPSLFPKAYKKQRNSFIYTSGSFRGLKRLVILWEQILLKIPNATLKIASYETFPKDNDEDRFINECIQKHSKSIQHLGKLNQKELYTLMEKCEFWLYPCSFSETSCITALEMLMSKVICLYYPIAGLTDTLGMYGIKIQEGNEIEKILELTPDTKKTMQENGVEYAKRCSWENRAIEWKKLIKIKKVMYARDVFPKIVLEDYINSLQTEYSISYTTDLPDDTTDELIYIHEIYNKDLLGKYKYTSYLNTEPLNLECRMLYIEQNVPKDMKIYDYSLSNIKILNASGFTNTHHLLYHCNKTERDYLKELWITTKKEYDFGILCSASVQTNDPNALRPKRRRELVQNLIKNGYTIHVISGFGKQRDIELAKCTRILNIHGQFDEIPTTIFEHIRCDRLLDAGYNILSENSMDQINSRFIQFKSYESIFNMKKRKIIDCFTFYNELEMLEYRLETLHHYIDTFILVEATLTHVGKPKELFFEKNKHLFTKYNIVHIIVDDFPFTEKNINCKNNEQWVNEKFQRNCIARGLAKLELYPKDLIVISDVDEIPDPLTLIQCEIEGVYQLEQDFYYYNIESEMDHKWYFSKIMTWEWFLQNECTCDDVRMGMFKSIPFGGWHLSYFGNSSFIANKIKNFAHQEYNTNEFTSQELIEQRIKNRVDIYDRDIKINYINVKENVYLPPHYNNKKYYCFIHSCNFGKTNRLTHLMDAIEKSKLPFEERFINNIGRPIPEYTNFKVSNHSDVPILFEMPTITRMIKFSRQHPEDYILYVHTKGICHPDDYQELNDWIDLMLYFLLQPDTKRRLEFYDCVGCNYKEDPSPHFSGNFWWVKCEYLAKLTISDSQNKNDAEYHLFTGNPKWYSLHTSTVNHYHERYPREKYESI